MQKIISAKQTREADQFTIENEPISSYDLMERASSCFVEAFVDHFNTSQKIHVVCGIGNNGGDGLAIARILKKRGYTVLVDLVKFNDSLSPDCQKNLELLQPDVHEIKADDFSLRNTDVMIDALFGSGLNQPIKGSLASVVGRINQSAAKVVSVDVPSGLFADEVNLEGEIVQSDLTITFQRPKLTFMIPETGRFLGDLKVVDIGLSEEFIESQHSDHYIQDDHVFKLIPRRKKFSHKGGYGRIQVFAGSEGKLGAAFLASKAALRTGCGLLTIHTASCGQNVLQTNLPEAMMTIDTHSQRVTQVKLDPKTDAVCFGPGLGTHKETVAAFRQLLEKTPKRLVVDADGLNILASHTELQDLLSEGTILTPHLGEFHRLFGDCQDGLERIKIARHIAMKKQWVIVIKGAHTAVISSAGIVSFNHTGNPGMATAGSGDVLSGIITSWLAQGLAPAEAAVLGLAIHGKSGDLAKKSLGEQGIMASDLLDFVPKAILNV